jgi:hypothetical protein
MLDGDWNDPNPECQSQEGELTTDKISIFTYNLIVNSMYFYG